MLTDQQTETLFKFCRQHYIHFYDVQVELVDHLGNIIEEKMKADPALCFEWALEKAYHEFGGYKGLQKVQEEKKKMVQKENARLKWRLFLSYFTLPRIVLTALIALSTYMGLTYLDPRVVQVLVPVVFMGVLVKEMPLIWRYQHRTFQNKHQLLLFESGGSAVFILLWMVSFNHVFDAFVKCVSTTWGSLSLEVWPMVFFLTLYILTVNCYSEYMRKVHEKARNLYPQLFARA